MTKILDKIPISRFDEKIRFPLKWPQKLDEETARIISRHLIYKYPFARDPDNYSEEHILSGIIHLLKCRVYDATMIFYELERLGLKLWKNPSDLLIEPRYNFLKFALIRNYITFDEMHEFYEDYEVPDEDETEHDDD
jgi:hypothetical protein